jgi:hypothetical protein
LSCTSQQSLLRQFRKHSSLGCKNCNNRDATNGTQMSHTLRVAARKASHLQHVAPYAALLRQPLQSVLHTSRKPQDSMPAPTRILTWRTFPEGADEPNPNRRLGFAWKGGGERSLQVNQITSKGTGSWCGRVSCRFGPLLASPAPKGLRQNEFFGDGKGENHREQPNRAPHSARKQSKKIVPTI